MMALAVPKGAEGAGGLEVKVKKASEAKNRDLLAADGIIFGSPTYFGQMSARLKAVIDESEKIQKKLTGKVGGAFINSGETASGGETTLLSIVLAMLIHRMIVQGRADNTCFGVAVTCAPSKETFLNARNLAETSIHRLKK